MKEMKQIIKNCWEEKKKKKMWWKLTYQWDKRSTRELR